MAKKNLSRSILEGGRSESDKDERRQSHVKSRREARLVLKEAAVDADAADDAPGLRKLPKIGSPSHAPDKDGGVERFLESRIGKPWSKTFSLLKDNFDARTTTGRHILYDHIFRDIAFDGEDHRTYARWRVDAAGILHQIPYARRSSYKAPNPNRYYIQGYNYVDVLDFLGGRWIVKLDGVLTWSALRHSDYLCKIEFDEKGFPSMSYRMRCSYGMSTPSPMRKLDMWSYRVAWNGLDLGGPQFKEGTRLTPAEARYFFKLPLKVQTAILDASASLASWLLDRRLKKSA